MTRRIGLLIAGYAALVLAGFLLVARASYQPGKLLAAHAGFGSRCAACHRPWHGADNRRCIACHGDFATNNPHGGYDVTDQKDGLIAGMHLATFNHELSCLTCHVEHRGRHADFHVQAAFSCTWCHKHPAIDKVAEHTTPTLMRHASGNQMFKEPFDHYQHSLLMMLQASNFPNGFVCTTCHLVTPVAPGAPDQMAIAWKPCAFCHQTPQVKHLELPASLGTSPKVLPYSGVVRTLHINGVFNHSKGHLTVPCEKCHLKMAASKAPTDADSLVIVQCFGCHAHQPPAPGASRLKSVEELMPALEGAANAATDEHRVVACGQCHLFHVHGPVPTLDFPKPALKQPPAGQGLVLTAWIPVLHHAAGSTIPRIEMERTAVSPWSIGAAAIVLIGLCAVAYTVMLPGLELRRGDAVADVAPQRMLKTPVLDDTYQTSLKGLYIIGETAGTASINLAMRSGRQVIESIAETFKHAPPALQIDQYDVAIIGCGPAGLAATATAKARGLKYATLERMTPASTLRTFPRAKFVQATPIDVMEYGSFFLEGDATREDLIKEWEKIISQAGLVINDREEVMEILPQSGYFAVRTAAGHEFKSRCVVLAIGLRGHPRRLQVPGEEPGRVHYQLIEPGDFRNRKILVVGGGNAGAEVTQALAAPHLGNSISYSYRDEILRKVTHENGQKVIALQRSGAITVYPGTEVKEIQPGKVILKPLSAGDDGSAQTIELDNDLVFAMLGAELPIRFLESIGIRMEIRHR